uniref:PHD finger-containing protein DDB_G0268158-like isoform X2 n=1 Tax=Dermatophagoides pteronyssinus TaxID=6956 RepID=A0A6P6Y0A2_DERPT|nr:PHD finger-containing protein DDB_G0268158-like isoform X2 [Dermatophagoides pteronyssinus]
MNVDNNSDPNESLEAPEDDDFGDFEGAEDEAPEAVQAMIGGPNWVYPDLVRIQSTNNNTQNDMNNHELNNLNNQNRQNSHRILDPPDVSLLTNISNSHCSKPQQTLDLCSSLGSSLNNPIPSTSNGIISSSTVFSMNQQLSQMEQRIRSLQTEKRLLQEQLCERDNRINDLQRIAHHQQHQTCVEPNSNVRSLEETIGRRIDSAVERIESNLESSMADIVNRVERLERKVDKNISSGSLTNGMVIDNGNGELLHHESCLQLFQQLKQEQQQERQEYMKTLSNILSHALHELNNTFKP